MISEGVLFGFILPVDEPAPYMVFPLCSYETAISEGSDPRGLNDQSLRLTIRLGVREGRGERQKLNLTN